MIESCAPKSGGKNRVGPAPGVRRPISDEWRDALPKRLADKGWNLSDLARAVGVTRQAINVIVRGQIKGSALLGRIDEALGGTSSIAASHTADLDDGVLVLQLFARLNATSRIKAIERMRTLLSMQDGIA